jgi:hydrogenase expression/formation protein HypC
VERSDFKGNQVDVSLAMVPDAECGSWVLVHAGYALEQLDENEALETWQWLQQAKIVEVGDLPEPLQKLADSQAEETP